MSRLRLVLRAIPLTFILTACTAGPGDYALVGKFEGRDGHVVADINRNMFHGEATVSARRGASGPVCNGVSQVTYSPLISLGCKDLRGAMRLQCTGPGAVEPNWVASSCDTGFGESAEEDESGFTFAFGQDLTETRAQLERLTR